MSIDYLRSFVDIAESCPNDIQPDMTVLQIQIDDCEDLLSNLKDEQRKLVTDDGEINAGGLIDYHSVIKKLVPMIKEKEAYCKRIAATVEESRKKLETEKQDYLSGAYEKRDIAPPEPEPKVIANPRTTTSSKKDAGAVPKRKRPPASGKAKPEPKPQSRDINPPLGSSQPKKKSRPNSKPDSTKPPQARPSSRPSSRPRYCRPECLAGDSGEMVACDTDGCPFGEWFHLACVGLRVPPPEDKKWYCFECRRKRSS